MVEHLVVIDGEDAGQTPLLDLHRLINEHKETTTLVFQPQGYRVVLCRPSFMAVLSVNEHYGDMLNQLTPEVEDLLAKQTTGVVLSEDELRLANAWNNRLMPLSNHMVALCLHEPKLKPDEVASWLATLAPNQLEKLYDVVTGFVKPDDAEISDLKN